MARYIVKVGDRYGEWSTIVDAPATVLGTREQFEEFYLAEYGKQGMKGLPARMERVESRGTSSMLDMSAEETVSLNRYGENETELSPDDVFRKWNEESDDYWSAREAATK